jgi:putative peptidoglycan lipid II flippase
MARFFAVRAPTMADDDPPQRTGRLAHAALLLSISLVLSRLLGVLRNALIADVFGNGPSINAYFAAFRIPDTMFTLVSGGALASAFIPVFSGLLVQQRERQAWVVASSVFNAVAIVLAGVALIAFVLAGPIMSFFVGGFTPPQRAEAVDLTRIMLLQPIFLGTAAVVSATLQSYSRWLLTAIAPLIYNIVVVIGAAFGHVYGVTGLAWSVVLAAVAQLLIQIPGMWDKIQSRYFFHVDRGAPGVRAVMQLFAPRVVGLAAFQAMLFVTLFLASRLPSGAVGAITYSYLLVAFPVGALGSAAGTALLPKLSELAASRDYETIRRHVNETMRLVLFLALPAAVGLIVLRRPIINLVYGHGAWTYQDTEQTAYALIFYALAIAALATIEVLPRVFYAMHDTRTPVRIAVIAVLVDTILSIVFVGIFPRSSGQGGLALATAVATTLQVVWLAVALERALGTIGRRSIVGALRDAVIAALSMGLVLYVVLDWLTAALPQRGITDFIIVAVEVSLGVAVFAGISYVLGAPELWAVARLVDRRRKRGTRGAEGSPRPDSARATLPRRPHRLP